LELGEPAIRYLTEIVHRRPRQWYEDVDRLHQILRSHGPEVLRRAMEEGLKQQIYGALYVERSLHGSHSVLDEYPAELRIGRRGGDVTQPQADGYVRLRIDVDLLKGCFQQALKVDSSNARANDAGRIVEQLLRWLSGREEDQDAA
jgi:hypothetical protein